MVGVPPGLQKRTQEYLETRERASNEETTRPEGVPPRSRRAAPGSLSAGAPIALPVSLNSRRRDHQRIRPRWPRTRRLC